MPTPTDAALIESLVLMTTMTDHPYPARSPALAMGASRTSVEDVSAGAESCLLQMARTPDSRRAILGAVVKSGGPALLRKVLAKRGARDIALTPDEIRLARVFERPRKTMFDIVVVLLDAGMQLEPEHHRLIHRALISGRHHDNDSRDAAHRSTDILLAAGVSFSGDTLSITASLLKAYDHAGLIYGHVAWTDLAILQPAMDKPEGGWLCACLCVLGRFRDPTSATAANDAERRTARDAIVEAWRTASTAHERARLTAKARFIIGDALYLRLVEQKTLHSALAQ